MNPFSADRITRRPWPYLIAALLATLASVALMLRLTPATSIESLLDRSDPSVAALGKVMSRFPVVEELLVLATLPDDAPADTVRLIAFAKRFESLAASDDDASRLIAAVRWSPPPDMRRFVEREIVPNGLDYLDADAYAALNSRLTRAGMEEQLARSKAALAAPGPAAGELGKQLVKDPLRLHEFLTARLATIGVNMADAEAFYSPDRRSILLRISGTTPPGDLAFCRQITAAAQRLASEANREPSLTIDIAGAYAVAAHSAGAIRRDAIVGVNTSIVGIALLFLLFYRRPVRQFLFAFVPMAMGMSWGFGIYALTHDTFTPLAAVVGGALGGVGIDYFVFFLANYRGEATKRRSDGATEGMPGTNDPFVASSLRRSVAHTTTTLRRPLLAAWATSVIGFLAIAISPIGLLRDFAVLGALALLGAYVATITLLPAMLTAFDFAKPRAVEDARVGFLTALGLRIAARPRRILVVATIGWLALASFIALSPGTFRPSANLMSLHPQPNPRLEAQRRISTRMGLPPGSVQIYLEASDPKALLLLAHDVDRRLRSSALKSAGFTGTFGVASLLPDPAIAESRRASIDPQRASRIAFDLRKALTDAGFETKPFEPYFTLLNRLLTPEGASPDLSTLARYPQAARLLSREAASGALATDALTLAFFDTPLDTRASRDAALAALRESLSDLPGVTITGMTPISAHVESAVFRDLPRFILVALFGIAVCLFIHFRSLKLGLLAITPTIVSLTVVLAFMKFTGQPLTLVNMIAAPLLIGIDVDYSILTISAWMRSRSRSEFIATFPTTAAAVMTCVATTLLGFGTLALTSIPAIQSLGVLIIVGVLACLAASWGVLWPALLLWKKDD